MAVGLARDSLRDSLTDSRRARTCGRRLSLRAVQGVDENAKGFVHQRRRHGRAVSAVERPAGLDAGHAARHCGSSGTLCICRAGSLHESHLNVAARAQIGRRRNRRQQAATVKMGRSLRSTSAGSRATCSCSRHCLSVKVKGGTCIAALVVANATTLLAAKRARERNETQCGALEILRAETRAELKAAARRWFWGHPLASSRRQGRFDE